MKKVTQPRASSKQAAGIDKGRGRKAATRRDFLRAAGLAAAGLSCRTGTVRCAEDSASPQRTRDYPPFTREEALALWSRLIAGWAKSLDASGARTNMPGIKNQADTGGSYEGVTRMLWGLGGWLSQPNRPNVLRYKGESFDTLALMKRAICAGCDPTSAGFWGLPKASGQYDQRTVESGQISFSLWLTRERIWNQCNEKERANILAWLEANGGKPKSWGSNWALFWCLNHAGRKALGERHDQSIIDSVLEYLDGVYCGNGWYDDAPHKGGNHFDDYNFWVFSSHVLAWAQCDGHTQSARRDELLGRVKNFMQHVPYFFGADGAYTHYGRSLAYKFARLGAPLWAYKLGQWPHAPGMLRRLAGRHLRWYVQHGAVRDDDTLRQELSDEGSSEIRESYIATGSTYWAMQAFGGLWSIPDDDPFWTADEQPLPVEQNDFTKIYPESGWIAVGTRATGGVQRFIAQTNAGGDKCAKYGKFVYSTLAPFNVGRVDGASSPDSMLCLSDGTKWAQRENTESSALGEPGWLRVRYAQNLGGKHHIDTTIIIRGQVHVRAHRITLDDAAKNPLSAVEGGAAFGFSKGETPKIESNATAGWEKSSDAARSCAILRIKGYDGQSPAAAWNGRHDLNSVYGDYVIPLLSASRLNPQHELVCLNFIGAADIDMSSLAAMVGEAAWQNDGSFKLTWNDGQTVLVPPLK